MLAGTVALRGYLLAQIFHPFPASVKFDGMEFGLLAQTIRPLSVSVKFEGMKLCLLAQTIHQLSALAKYGWCGNLFTETNYTSISGIG